MGMIGGNLNEAIQELKRFSNEQDEAKYIDEDDEMIKTLYFTIDCRKIPII